MDGERVYGDSNMTVKLQNDRLPCSSEVLESLWNSNSSPSFQGDSVSCSTSMPNFEDVRVGNQIDTKRPFFSPLENEENGNEDYDSCLHQPEKKRRLTTDQVQFLERNFEVENKLEPERKELLAKELGLQARQVAIWFQNRRARFKTKQIEKDYCSLKSSYDKLNEDYECLLKEKERLRNEVQLLKDKLLLREKESTNLEPTDPVINPVIEKHYKKISNASVEASSAKSDVFDSDSPHWTDGNHSNSFLEPANSYHGFGAEQSDFSQDDEDELTRSLLPPPFLPKLENYCNWSFQIEPQPCWLWP